MNDWIKKPGVEDDERLNKVKKIAKTEEKRKDSSNVTQKKFYKIYCKLPLLYYNI